MLIARSDKDIEAVLKTCRKITRRINQHRNSPTYYRGHGGITSLNDETHYTEAVSIMEAISWLRGICIWQDGVDRPPIWE